VSGFAGAFYGAELGIVSPEDFQFAVSVTALSTVVLGGIGSITGAAVGGLLISFIIFWILPHAQEWSTTFGKHHRVHRAVERGLQQVRLRRLRGDSW